MKNETKDSTAITVEKEKPTAITVSQTPQTIPGLVASDIVIPKVLLMQGLSEAVAGRKAQLGDMVRSTTMEKLGDPEHPIDFIPLSIESNWIIEFDKEGKWVFLKTEPRSNSNSNLPWNFYIDLKTGQEVTGNTANATKARRVNRLGAYALLPSDIEADLIERKKAEKGEFVDFNKALMPVLLSFRALSFASGGKSLATYVAKAQSFNQPIHKAVLKLKCFIDQNAKGTFYTFDVEWTNLKPVKKEYMATVEYWANLVNAQKDKLKVDDADETETVTPSEHF